MCGSMVDIQSPMAEIRRGNVAEVLIVIQNSVLVVRSGYTRSVVV